MLTERERWRGLPDAVVSIKRMVLP